MTNLYKDLASVYEAMYQTFIDYQEEFVFYSNILKKYNKKSLVEIGSGTGNLAHYFLENNFDYIGLDYSKDMIAIAQNKVTKAQFIEGDMRAIDLPQPVQSALITGRTINYLVEGKDIMSTFDAIHKNLAPNGILCFDFIDANKFILDIAKEPKVVHSAVHENIEYTRTGIWTMQLDSGMDMTWNATYSKKVANEWVEIGTDQAKVRAFTLNEMELFLHLNNFNVKEVIERASYAFPTYVMVAERI